MPIGEHAHRQTSPAIKQNEDRDEERGLPRRSVRMQAAEYRRQAADESPRRKAQREGDGG